MYGPPVVVKHPQCKDHIQTALAEKSRIWDLKGRTFKDTVLSTMWPSFLGRRAEVSAWELWGGNIQKNRISTRYTKFCRKMKTLIRMHFLSLHASLDLSSLCLEGYNFPQNTAQLDQDDAEQPAEARRASAAGRRRGNGPQELHRVLQPRRDPRRGDAKCQVDYYKTLDTGVKLLTVSRVLF